jgi:hypothetical protein
MRPVATLLLIPALWAQAADPKADEKLTGSADIGYRWISGVGGDFQTYRSVVNFGEGVKLLGADLKYEAGLKWLDRVTARANGWGGEPFSTAYLDAEKANVYRLIYTHQGINYFNFLPSFANPQLSQGIFLNQRSFDTRYRMDNLQFDVKPGNTLVPYFAWSRAQSGGRGINNFVAQGNEYPVATGLDYATNDYRGGFRFETKWLNGFLEQGGLTIGEVQEVNTVGRNPGNRSLPFLGQTLFLDSLIQRYDIDGSSIYTRAAINGTPTSWLSFNGQFLFSQPETSVHFDGTGTGSFVNLNPFLFFEQGSLNSTSFARQPHSSGVVGLEFRPVNNLRIVNTWFTDRLHNASTLAATEALVGGSPFTLNDNARLEVNYNYNQTDLFADAGKFTTRVGWRYVWGDARVRPGQVSFVEGLEQGRLQQGVALLGAAYRPTSKVVINLDYENGMASQVYFRTSLADYRKGRGRLRYNILESLSVTGTARVLDNQNNRPEVGLDFQAQDYGGTVLWNPNQGQRFSVMADYTHSYIRSDISYLQPQILQPAVSTYRDRANTGTVMGDVGFPGFGGLRGRLTAGGSIFVSEGSRPTRYYQPIVRVAVPVQRHMQLSAEYRWYGFTQPIFLFEGFRNHQLMFAVRLIR